jgi:hypothetical protein
MKNKKSICKISGILVLLVFMLGFILAGCTAQNKTADKATTPRTETTTAAETTVVETTAETTAAETQSTEQLSEQPDKAKYDEYFTDFYLGKLPLGKQVGPDNIPVKTAVFIASEDEFCPMLTLKKDIPLGSFSFAVYDTVAKKDFAPKAVFPVALNVGSHGWADDPIEYPIGKYEYKLYIDDMLVVVAPFEVR